VTPRRLRSIVGGSVGNLVEWYDWYVYSAFSLYFAQAFFPPASQTAQLLNAAAVFAVGFLMRPVGGWLMGRYADRHGRRAALSASVLLMSVGSLVIAATPTYASIGAAAPALLVAARLLQGLSVGGEYGASATYLSEMAGQRRRGFYSSFQYVTLIMGQLLALGVLLLLQRQLSPPALEAWGWRIPFAVGALCAVLALWLRRGLDETDAFRAARASAAPHGRLRALLAHPRQVATVVGLTAGGTVAFYTFTTYAQKFLVTPPGSPRRAPRACRRRCSWSTCSRSRSSGSSPTASAGARCSSPSACSARSARCPCSPRSAPPAPSRAPSCSSSPRCSP